MCATVSRSAFVEPKFACDAVVDELSRSWHEESVSDTGVTRGDRDAAVRRRVVVHGFVQGVFFRDSVRRRALASNVSGWVRNNRDGTVEAALEGSPAAVERLVAFCLEGPRGARVDRVEVTEESLEGLRGFEIR
jgi:acylphosphatase